MRRALLLSLALLSLPAAAFELQPFTASYTADWKQLPISGSAERNLKALDNGRWELEFEASMLVAGLTEVSVFTLEKGTFLPLSYHFGRSGIGKSKEINLDFDWQQKQVMGTHRDESVHLPLNRGLLDKSTYQLALQQDVADGMTSMTYQVVDGDEVETYDFRVLGEERVRTKAGLIDAIKVERVRDPTKSSRKTILWLAKDWNFLLVRLHQVEKDGKEYQIMLKQGEVAGREVQGKAE